MDRNVDLRTSKFLFVPASAVLFALSFFLWAMLGLPEDMPEVPGGRLECISYTPWDRGSTPLQTGYSVSDERMRDDLHILSQYTDCIRIYSASGSEGRVVGIAEHLGLKVLLGLWIGRYQTKNDREIAAAIELINTHRDTVRALIVGNEVMLRQEMTQERLASMLGEVKRRSGLPVSYADSIEPWLDNIPLAEAVDFISVHVLPYWSPEGPVSVQDAPQKIERTVTQLRDAFPGKDIFIAEIGWPSDGPSRRAAHPGLVNQARFIRAFAAQAERLNLSYNVLEGLDQSWKRYFEGTVGGSWGLLTPERGLKFPLQGPVSAWPDWHARAGIAFVIGLFVLVSGLLNARSLTPMQWFGLTALAAAFGNTLVMQTHYVGTVSFFALEWIVGIAGMASTIAATALLTALIHCPQGDWRRSAPGSLLTMLQSIRQIRGGTGISRPAALGLLHWSVAFPAAVISLMLAFAPTHRDIPYLLYWLPALAFLIHAWLGQREPRMDGRRTTSEDRPEEAWTAFVLL
ncbi:MAG: hypothetical protein H6905_11670, partial [Hyphomicrobiales bacterium]|nr:hypothetical protein [Hyphomicrobiales bacterium]